MAPSATMRARNKAEADRLTDRQRSTGRGGEGGGSERENGLLVDKEASSTTAAVLPDIAPQLHIPQAGRQ